MYICNAKMKGNSYVGILSGNSSGIDLYQCYISGDMTTNGCAGAVTGSGYDYQAKAEECYFNVNVVANAGEISCIGCTGIDCLLAGTMKGYGRMV